MIEGSSLGGTCVNVGCVPKKVMFNAAKVAEMLHSSHHYGFSLSNGSFDWNFLKSARDDYVLGLNDKYAYLLRNSNVDTVFGRGRFVGPNKVCVGKDVYSADHICIAVGGKPRIPNFNGAQFCLTSNDFFHSRLNPKDLLLLARAT